MFVHAAASVQKPRKTLGERRVGHADSDVTCPVATMRSFGSSGLIAIATLGGRFVFAV